MNTTTTRAPQEHDVLNEFLEQKKSFLSGAGLAHEGAVAYVLRAGHAKDAGTAAKLVRAREWMLANPTADEHEAYRELALLLGVGVYRPQPEDEPIFALEFPRSEWPASLLDGTFADRSRVLRARISLARASLTQELDACAGEMKVIVAASQGRQRTNEEQARLDELVRIHATLKDPATAAARFADARVEGSP